ncbi:MAG: YidC/Oxa1 family membrane protein insertase, partial [Treponema sp.]|nr:YidC/Oxa1 family membrane protein insertase [Treponema sp.]
MFYTLVIYPLTQIIEFVYSFCYKIFGNTGISVIGVSCAVSLLTLPLYIVAEHWQQVERDIQKRMKGEVDKIRDVFRGNERYMILSTYYRQQRYHPIMSLRSAFGLLIQIPFFTAAYACLSNMGALQGQSFLFIRDMGAPDALFKIGSFDVNILPIAMTLINMVSGTLYTRGLPLRDKIQTYGLALIFVAIIYDSPAGLVMYWTMNNVFSLVKNVFYKLKNPVKTLYVIACALVTVFIVWLFAGRVLSPKRAALVSCVLSLVYAAPLIVKFANYLAQTQLRSLTENRKQTTSLFVSACAGLCVLCGLVASSTLISINPTEFCGIKNFENPLFFIKNTFLQSIGFFITWPALIFFLYNNNKKIQALLAYFMGASFLCALANFFLFRGSYGNISTSLVFTTASSVDSPIKQIALNLSLLLFIFAAVAAIAFIRKSFATIFACATATLALFSFGIYNANTVNTGYSDYANMSVKQATHVKPIFHFSKTGKNVLLLYLDRAQSKYLQAIFEECPELYSQFEGFTYYPQTLSLNGHTLMGSPPCFGGYEYSPAAINKRPGDKLVDKTNEALLTLPRIFTEQGQDFSATVTDMPWAGHTWIPDLSIYARYNKIDALQTDSAYDDYWFKSHKEFEHLANKAAILKRNLLWYGFFKISPLALRPAFYNQGSYWSTEESNEDFMNFLDGYSVLEILPQLTDTQATAQNAFICFVNNTTHDDYPLQAPDFVPSLEVTNKGKSKFAQNSDYAVNAGALKRVGEWFGFLKENAIYDNTRIAIVADHGPEFGEDDFFKDDEKFKAINPGKYHPLLM